ncbi:hypothetical protein FVE85_5970 [Porphyridium purpureum]|uniref:Uncharacterized protein n=1 Tax=Porphyridium purpureum TaxID=35688 RepID=A0A5J4Z4Y4_PORPP|nr:hypothetical protein FVE85_5970 [Porphyridium purpureum]|eukprot:POR6417..scf295_1
MPDARLDAARIAFHAAVEDALRNGLADHGAFFHAVWKSPQEQLSSDADMRSDKAQESRLRPDVLQRERTRMLRIQFEQLLRRNVLAQFERVSSEFDCEQTISANESARAHAATMDVLGGARVGIDDESSHALRSELDTATANAPVEALRAALEKERQLLDEERERASQAREQLDTYRAALEQTVRAAVSAVNDSAASRV